MTTTSRIQGSLRFGPHAGYYGLANYDDEARIFHGEAIGLRDVVTFQGTTVEELEKAFTESVDDYLAFCKVRGESPEKPFSGKFITRVAPTLHKRLSQAAELRSQSLNAYVESVLRKAVTRSPERRLLRRSAKRRSERTASVSKGATGRVSRRAKREKV